MSKINDQDFLEYIVKALVDHPDDIKIDRNIDEMGVLLSLKVNPKDMGQIIGRQGSTVRAIRSLVRIIGLKNHARVNLKIEEPAEDSALKKQEISTEKAEVEKSPKDDLDDLKL